MARIKERSIGDLWGDVHIIVEQMQSMGESLPHLLIAQKQLGQNLNEIVRRERSEVRFELALLKKRARILGIKKP